MSFSPRVMSCSSSATVTPSTDNLAKQRIVEPTAVVEPKIHAEIFFAKDGDDDLVARTKAVVAVRGLGERRSGRQPHE